MKRALVAVLFVALAASGLAACRPAHAGARCRTVDWGQDASHVLRCTRGRWRRVATKADVARALAAIVAARTTTTSTPPTPVVQIHDTDALARFIAGVPDLAPASEDAGCEQLDLLSLDLASGSAHVFHEYAGQSPCPGDPFSVYLEVTNNEVTSSVSCAEDDQTGGCDSFAGVRAAWAGRTVTTVDIRSCSSPTGVCIDGIRQTVRT